MNKFKSIVFAFAVYVTGTTSGMILISHLIGVPITPRSFLLPVWLAIATALSGFQPKWLRERLAKPVPHLEWVAIAVILVALISFGWAIEFGTQPQR